MINTDRVLAIVPARGGSKGLPGKNLMSVGGRPLIAWALTAARESRFVDEVVLTSDDPEILDLGAALGFDSCATRRAELATDETPMIDVILDALDAFANCDIVVLLQPTSPLRTAADVDATIDLVANGAPAAVSVTRVEQHPSWMFFADERGALRPVAPGRNETSRRQDLPDACMLNGAVYVARPDWLRQTRTFVSGGTIGYWMPASRAVDIDSAEDLAHAEALLR